VIGVHRFLWPEALPLLLLPPLLWALVTLRDRARARRLAEHVGPRHVMLAGERSPRRRRARHLAYALALLFALVAAMGPAFGGTAPGLAWRGVDVVIALDVSRSMLAGDMPPNRLTHAKQQVRALAERAVGDRLGLVVFAGEARRLVPLTADRRTFVQLADLADPYAVRRGGSDLGAALEAAGSVLAGRTGEHGTVLLLTDGEDLEGRARAAAARLGGEGISVHTVGFGTPRGGKIALPGKDGETFLRDRNGNEVVSTLESSTLHAIADATGGGYLDATAADTALVDLYEERILPMAREAFEAEGRRTRETHQQPFLLAACLCVLAVLATTDRRRR